MLGWQLSVAAFNKHCWHAMQRQVWGCFPQACGHPLLLPLALLPLFFFTRGCSDHIDSQADAGTGKLKCRGPLGPR